MGRARVEGHIAIYESVKVILVVGVALSLSFSSPLQPLASHSFVARRSSRPLSSSPSSRSLPPPPLLLLRTLLLRTSLVARRGRRRRRPRRVRGIASRSRAASLALIIYNIDSVCAHHHHSSTVDRRSGLATSQIAVSLPQEGYISRSAITLRRFGRKGALTRDSRGVPSNSSSLSTKPLSRLITYLYRPPQRPQNPSKKTDSQAP